MKLDQSKIPIIEYAVPRSRNNIFLKYAIIGFGDMGNQHFNTLQLIDKAKVVAVCDPSLKSHQEVHERLGSKIKIYNDYKRMLGREEIDVVIVATPNDTHMQILEDLQKFNVAVLCEKPLAADVEGCRRILGLSKNSSNILQIGFELRSSPIFKQIFEIIDSGRVGTPIQLWWKEFRGPWLHKVDNWVLKSKRSGGTLVEKNSHHFDLFNWFTKSKPSKVFGFGSCDSVNGQKIFGTRPDVLDNAQVVLKYESGAIATLMLSMQCPFYDEGHEIGVVGDKGYLIGNFKQNGKHTLKVTCDSKSEFIEFSGPQDILNSSHGGSVYFEHIDFISRLNDSLTFESNVNDAYLATMTGLAAEHAVKNGVIVDFKKFENAVQDNPQLLHHIDQS
jgi:predicted dehydrogenase